MIKRIFIAILFLTAVVGFSQRAADAGTLSCSVSTTCPTGTIVMRFSSSTNAHAELAAEGNYGQLLCCTGVTGLGTSCSGTFASIAKLAASTNAHIEQSGQGSFPTNACLSVPGGGSVSVGYSGTTCAGYDTTLASMSGIINAHVGTSTAYSQKICASAVGGAAQSLTFSISDNTIGFGSLNSSAARYASGDTIGSSSDAADAHTISVGTNAESGYTMTLSGATLACPSCGGATITAIGGGASASSPGAEQFGARMTVNSGTGTVSSPYNSSNWAFDTASFPDVVASGPGDGTLTEYGARYIGNSSPTTETGSYSAVLIYAVTATF